MTDKLEELAREQFEQLRAERNALAEERRRDEEASKRRKQELDRQTQTLIARLDALEERERALTGRPDTPDADELETLRKQASEHQTRVELLQAERDAAWGQLHAAVEESERQRAALQAELAAAQQQLEEKSRDADHLRQRLDNAERQSREYFASLQVHPADDSDVDLGSNQARLLRQYGLEHTDLRLAELGEICSGLPCEAPPAVELERDSLREQVIHLRALGQTQHAELEELRRRVAFLNLQEIDKALDHLNAAARAEPENRMIRTLATLLSQRQGRSAVGNMRVLVVDDSATHTLFVRSTLESHGFDVSTAGDGADALNKLHGIDLILLDITMPGMDGYEVCKKVREDPLTAAIPVILLSGKDGFFDKVRGRMVGANDYLTKPCAPTELVEMIRRFANPATTTVR